MVVYKLLRIRKDGTLGPLFIDARLRVPLGVELRARDVPTKGFARRPGWHSAAAPVAPHLSERGEYGLSVPSPTMPIGTNLCVQGVSAESGLFLIVSL